MEFILNLLIKNDNFELSILEWIKTWDLNLRNLKNLKDIQIFDNLNIFLNLTNLEEDNTKEISSSQNRKIFLKKFFYKVEELINNEYGKSIKDLTDIDFLFIFENLKKKKSSIFFIKLFLISLILTKNEDENFFLFEKINEIERKNIEIDDLKIFLEKTLNVFNDNLNQNKKMIFKKFEESYDHTENLIKKLNFENNQLSTKINFLEIENKKIKEKKKDLIINLDKITEKYHNYKDTNKKLTEERIAEIYKNCQEKYDAMYYSLKKIKNEDKLLKKNLKTLTNKNTFCEEMIKLKTAEVEEIKKSYIKKKDFKKLKKKLENLQKKKYEIENSYELEKSQVKYLQSKILKLKKMSPEKIENLKKPMTLIRFNSFNKKSYGSSHTILGRNDLSITTNVNIETNLDDLEKELKLSTFNNNEGFNNFEDESSQNSQNDKFLVNNSSRSHFLEDDLSENFGNQIYLDKMKQIEKELNDYKKNNEDFNRQLEKSNLKLKQKLEESERKSMLSVSFSQRSIVCSNNNNFINKVVENEKIIKSLKRDKKFLNKSLIDVKDYSNVQINLLYSMLLNN